MADDLGRIYSRLAKGGRAMHVGVIHRISDPQGFKDAEAKALEAGLPEGFKLPVHAETPDHTTALCVWEGPSVDAVRDLVEAVVGPFSTNEYYEMELDQSAV
jgi:hypothetical protein